METTISKAEHNSLKALVYRLQVQLDALRAKIRTVTAAYVATDADFTILVDASGAPITVTLPDPSEASGHVLNIKKIDNSDNVVTLSGDGSTIDGSATASIESQWQNLQVQSNGSAWFII